jgi:hypothetical protein
MAAQLLAPCRPSSTLQRTPPPPTSKQPNRGAAQSWARPAPATQIRGPHAAAAWLRRARQEVQPAHHRAGAIQVGRCPGAPGRMRTDHFPWLSWRRRVPHIRGRSPCSTGDGTGRSAAPGPAAPGRALRGRSGPAARAQQQPVKLAELGPGRARLLAWHAVPTAGPGPGLLWRQPLPLPLLLAGGPSCSRLALGIATPQGARRTPRALLDCRSALAARSLAAAASDQPTGAPASAATTCPTCPTTWTSCSTCVWCGSSTTRSGACRPCCCACRSS